MIDLHYVPKSEGGKRHDDVYVKKGGVVGYGRGRYFHKQQKSLGASCAYLRVNERSLFGPIVVRFSGLPIPTQAPFDWLK